MNVLQFKMILTYLHIYICFDITESYLYEYMNLNYIYVYVLQQQYIYTHSQLDVYMTAVRGHELGQAKGGWTLQAGDPGDSAGSPRMGLGQGVVENVPIFSHNPTEKGGYKHHLRDFCFGGSKKIPRKGTFTNTCRTV